MSDWPSFTRSELDTLYVQRSGGSVIQPTSDAAIPLTLKLHASPQFPTAFQILAADDSVIFRVDSTGKIGLSSLPDTIATQAELDTHTGLATGAHGGIVASSDSRLTDARVPTDGSVTNAKVASGAAIAYSKLALTGAVLEADLAFGIATQAELDASALLGLLKAPTDAARNTVQPTADHAVVTLKQFPTGGEFPGSNSKAPLIRLVAYGHPDLNGTASNKLITIENPNYGFWDPTQPQFYICTTGNLASNRDILLSGTVTGSGDSYVIQRPSTDPAMIWLWSDVNGPALQIRASTFGGEVLPPSFVADNYILSGMSPNGNYVFSVEQNGLLRWGAAGPASTTTRAQMDTYFGRVLFNATPTLCTNQGLALTTNQKGIYGMKVDGTTSVRMLWIDSANQLGVGQTGAGIPMHFWASTYRFVDDGNTVYRVEINASGVTLATGHNIVLATTGAGTKIGTGTTQKLSLWNKTPDVQPTTAITAAAFVANTSLTANDSATYGGYTIGQMAAALIRVGVLA